MATALAHKVTADSSGDYVVTPVLPGMYTISATSPGFQTTVQSGIELTVGQAARVDIDLRIGETSSQVQVTTEAALLSTESATLGQVISTQQITDLPLNGRKFTELGRMTPGVTLLPATGNVQRVRPEQINGNVISGVPGSQTTFLLDGVDITEQHQGGTWIQTSVDALQEFSVQQNGYSAEFARAGGSFNTTTKSGSNRVYGNLFEFLRNDRLDSRDFFSPTRALLKRNQFGGTVGGPVLIPRIYNGRNRTFFFFSYEGERTRQGLLFNSVVPSPAEMAGNFAAQNKIYDPLSTVPNPSGSGNVRTLFPGNIIPANRLSPQAIFYNKYIPAPNSGNANAIFTGSDAYNQDQWTMRGDQEITSNHKAFVRVSLVRNYEKIPSSFPALGFTELSGPARNIAAALTSNLRPNMIHEIRVSFLYGEYRSNAYFQGQGAALNKQAGLTGLEGNQDVSISSLPAFSWSGLSGLFGQRGRRTSQVAEPLGERSIGQPDLDQGPAHYQDRHPHSLLQAPVHRLPDSQRRLQLHRHRNGESPGDGEHRRRFRGLDAGLSGQRSRSNPATWWGGYGTYWHFFLQDDVKVNNRLTLNWDCATNTRLG